MTCAGEVRSPLEASVQRLCNTRPVEVMCTWTNTSLQFPHASAIHNLLRTGRRSSSIHPPPLQLSSFAATTRRSGGDFSLPCKRWELRWLNSPPSRQGLRSREPSHDAARVPTPAALRGPGGCRGPTTSRRETNAWRGFRSQRVLSRPAAASRALRPGNPTISHIFTHIHRKDSQCATRWLHCTAVPGR
jgi:hypothetical protein